ncbi:MAG TPA: SRPBCC family protein [Candidatus Limnocylindrales bacterium]|nr:SRPBCC family protein [Candidatus Limnocylindrales bacterium]
MTTRTATPIKVIAEPGLPFVGTEREVDAPRDLVFRCFAEPELLRQWLGPKRLEMRIDEFELRDGGRYRYVHIEPDGTEYGFHGVFHGAQTPDSMTQTFEFDGAPGHVSLDRIELVDLADGRTLVRSHSVHQSVEARDAMVTHGMADGMEQGYQKLDTLLAGLRAAR